MKRFWRVAAAVPCGPGHALALDGKVRQTPAGHDYVCSSQALAAALAAEWQNAPDPFDPRRMPLTQLAATALDIVAARRAVILDEIAAYAANDQLCFRVAQPQALARLQQEIWQPYLDWAATRFDALLRHGEGLQAPVQDKQALAALSAAAAAYAPFPLTVLQQATQLTGSLLLGLALTEEWRDAGAIHEAAELEARFQMTQWGMDEEAQARQGAIKDELTVLQRFARLSRAN